jgi:hypothetical protein
VSDKRQMLLDYDDLEARIAFALRWRDIRNRSVSFSTSEPMVPPRYYDEARDIIVGRTLRMAAVEP